MHSGVFVDDDVGGGAVPSHTREQYEFRYVVLVVYPTCVCVCVCVIPIVVAYIRHVFVTLSILVTFADLHARTRAFYILRQYIRVRPSVCSCIRFGRHQRGIWFCHCHTRRRYPSVKDSDREIRGPIVSRVTHSIHIVTVFRSPRPSRDRIYRR